MKTINLITLLLVIVGGINWGLVGFMHFNLVEAIFGQYDRVIYALVGLAALWQLVPFTQAVSTDEPYAEAHRTRHI